MKQRKRWLGLTIAPFALAMFAFAQPAHAIDYTSCAMVPNHVLGDANVNDPAGCVISADLLVDGSLTINSPSVDAKNITAGGNITINTSTGNIKTFQLVNEAGDIKLAAGVGDIETRKISAGTSVQLTAGLAGGITSKILVTQPIVINKTQDTPGHGNVIIRARGNVSTSTIRTDGELGAASLKTGGIEINANLANASNEFVIGGTGASNGVNGSLITTSSVGGGSDPIKVVGGIRIQNGGPSSTGDIRLVSMSNIRVTATESRSGWIELNAGGGKVILPSGKLNAEGHNPLETPEGGTSTQAGAIYLFGSEIETQAGTIISARQAPSLAGATHQVALITDKVTFKGEDGLRVLNDGNGFEGYNTFVLTRFSLNSQSNLNLQNLVWSFPGGASFNIQRPLNITSGEDRSPLVISSNGNNQGVAITGFPVTFKAGSISVSSKGSENHNIKVGYYGLIDLEPGLGFKVDATKPVVFDASATSGTGGIVDITAADAEIKTNTVFRLLANGPQPDKGDGDGGRVNFDVFGLVLDSSTRFQIEANAALGGVGNAVSADLDSPTPQAVEFKTLRSNLVLGTARGMLQIAAKGGTEGGNGGGVRLQFGPDTNGQLRNHEATIDVSAIGPTGNGGKIAVASSSFTVVQPANLKDVVPSFLAKGGLLAGEGGLIRINNLRVTSATNFLNVNAIFSVDGAPVRDPDIFHGRISINGVACRQRHTTSDYWFESWWSCANPDSPTPADLAVLDGANVLNGLTVANQLSNTLSPHNKSVQIYVMRHVGDYFAFLGKQRVNSPGVFGISTVDIRLAAVFTEIYIGGSSTASAPVAGQSPTIMKASIVHELGHQLDYIWGFPSDGEFATFRVSDLASMDAESCMTVFASNTVCDINQTTRNSEILKQLEPDLAEMVVNPDFTLKANDRKNKEFLARIFEHKFRIIGNYSYTPYLENSYGFLPLMIDKVDSLVASPPPAVN